VRVTSCRCCVHANGALNAQAFPRERPLVLLVQLSSERARHALRQDCSFAKQQDSPPALPVVV